MILLTIIDISHRHVYLNPSPSVPTQLPLKSRARHFLGRQSPKFPASFAIDQFITLAVSVKVTKSAVDLAYCWLIFPQLPPRLC